MIEAIAVGDATYANKSLLKVCLSRRMYSFVIFVIVTNISVLVASWRWGGVTAHPKFLPVRKFSFLTGGGIFTIKFRKPRWTEQSILIAAVC